MEQAVTISPAEKHKVEMAKIKKRLYIEAMLIISYCVLPIIVSHQGDIATHH
jgi:hypothetical protein